MSGRSMPSEASKLTAFLLNLQVSPQARARFKRRPKAEMRRFGLNPKTMNAVLTPDYKQLWRILCHPSIHIGVLVITETSLRRRKSKRA